MLARLVEDPAGQALTTALTDRVFRSRDPRRLVEQLERLCGRLGVPRYMPQLARIQLRAGRLVGPLLPGVIGRAVLAKVRDEARSVLLSAEPSALRQFVTSRHTEGVRVNVNQLGEALLGEREAAARVEKYAALAGSGTVDALSVKVSSIGSQLNLLAFDDTAETLAERLATIYRASLAPPENGRPVVMLDMEAYNDLALTFEVMKRALADRSLLEVRAGLVLQAYLPDSHALFAQLAELAEARVAAGGPPLRLRIVKGANLAHERVESEKHGLTLPIYARKEEVDASFKLLLESAVPRAQAGILELGVASHNLFDIAYALLLRAESGVARGIGIEMLEGMANDTVRALRALDVDVLVYAPICRDDAMSTGIAYLVRRLDENTSRENFLRASFAMRAGDAAFGQERERFRVALSLMHELDQTPRRARPRKAPGRAQFQGEPDSDFTRPEQRALVRQALWDAEQRPPLLLTSWVAGQPCSGGQRRAGADPSRPGSVPYHVMLATEDDVESALACAKADRVRWSSRAAAARCELLSRVAEQLRDARGELIAAMVMDAGKRVLEADPEVSEAIDFAEYYSRSYASWHERSDLTLTPRGSVLVTPPWNFPLAIAAGGVLAALVAGNRVILKPALETAFVGGLLAELIWRAGVPREALQLLLCEDDVASKLIEDPRIDSVILTGATETARLFQRLRPGLHLLAETGGKNAYIVSAMSDRELSIRDIVQSAFGHAGQKCSACSLLLLEAEVHDDPHFMATLKDAVESLHVGSAWDERSFVTPLIKPPSGPLETAINELAAGESWLVTPRVDQRNGALLSPGVKLGVVPGSFMHTTELFGPVLSVMRADSITHAIELANASGYGLTAGLASLDEREQAQFMDRLLAGNLYVNRTITGAIVERQPFGGMGKSGFGPGAKAGGPNYVLQLCKVEARTAPDARDDDPSCDELERRLRHFQALFTNREAAQLRAVVGEYARTFRSHFSRAYDFAMILGQDNLFRYRPARHVLLRVEHDASARDVALSCLAATLSGCSLVVSVAPDFHELSDPERWGHSHRREQLSDLARQLPQVARMRLLGSRSREHDELSASLGAHLADAPVLPVGRVELLHYLQEQSVSIDYHRYGNLGERALLVKRD